jgi:hypothetical protein
VAGRALEERYGPKLNRAARNERFPDRVNRQIAESADFARRGLGERGEIFGRDCEIVIRRREVNVNFIVVAGKSGLIAADRGDDEISILPLHEQRHKTIVGGDAARREHGEGVAPAGLAAPEMEAIRHFRRGGEGAGVAGK